jgi:hypothetical protein
MNRALLMVQLLLGMLGGLPINKVKKTVKELPNGFFI